MATETAIDVVMPQMGVSVSEGTVTKWLKQEGETVEADEPLLEISTDKVDTEVPSPGVGDVTQILVQEGETVEVGTKLAQIGGAAAGAQPEAAAPEAPPAQAPPEPRRRPRPTSRWRPRARARPRRAQQPQAARLRRRSGDSGQRKAFVSPVVARIASEHGVDPRPVQGTAAAAA